uniref:Titin n=1 Tax=Amphilophus citrinellus TaxID=61819 RepID=A0A3Q0SGI8_AMPCI
MVESPSLTTSWRKKRPQPRGGPESPETTCTQPLSTEVSGLFEGNTYEFRVFAENIAGISEPSLSSDPIKATRAITKPGPPGNPKLKDWSKSHADICWTKPTRDGGSPILGYVIEAQKSGSAQWDRINKDLVKICAYRVPGLIEGLEYRIRIRATNKVGDSEPRELPQTVLAKDILVPPEVVVDVSCRDSVTVRAGQIISLITRVKGRPDPEITWTKDARALSRDKRTEVNNNYPLCELVINDAIRSDYGKYAIVAKNSSGQAQATILVNVLDTPGACQNLKVAYVTKKSCMVSWENPEDNGGTEITQYIIECRQPSQRGWTVETYFMADRCIENQIYQFRVQTKNEGGESNWVTTAEVMVKEQLVVPEIKIKLDAALVVKAGDSIPIEATVMGKPQPDIKWTKDESAEEMKKGPRLQIESGADFSKLLLTGARRTDSGKYIVTASNNAGTCSLCKGDADHEDCH